MSLVRLIAQRIALGFVAVWAFLSTVFGLFTLTRDWVLETRLALAAYGGATPEQLEILEKEYLAARGLDRPIYELYFDWMSNMLTLEWGQSFQTGEPVFPAVMSATASTATYVIPAVLVAIVLGLAIGVYTALYRKSFHAGAVRSGTYLGLGLPHFWVGLIILALAGIPPGLGRLETALMPRDMPFFYGTVVPALLIALVLTAANVSYGRAYSMQYASADLTKLVRAKGGGTLDVARHVVRNAAIPLVSLVFAETFALLAISVFVIEALFGIDGLGLVIYNAVWERDLPIIMGASLVVVTAGVAFNIIQDATYSLLDPRVDTGTR